MKEVLKYCDQVSAIEESKPSSTIRLDSWEMEIRCIENAWIIPFSKSTVGYQGEVVSATGEVVPNVCSGQIYNEKHIVDIPADADEQDEVVYLGAVNPCWGHYITDGISKLWCLQNDEFKALIARGVPVMFVSEWMHVEQMGSAWRHLVDLLGGKDINIVPLKRITKFKRIYIPSNTIQHSAKGRFYTKEFTELANRLKSNALACTTTFKCYDKLYLSRTKLANCGHTEFGERQLESAFRKAGYHMIYPEKLSFEQQVYLLDNAKSVAGTMGSISHNFMFCRPGTDVVILRKAWYTNDFQYVINQVADLNVTYIDCNLSVFVNTDTNNGPFFLYINENVQRFFADRYYISLNNSFRRRKFSEYAMLCMQRGDAKERNVAPAYYYEKMGEELRTHIGVMKRIYRGLLSCMGGFLGDKVKQIVNVIRR